MPNIGEQVWWLVENGQSAAKSLQENVITCMDAVHRLNVGRVQTLNLKI